MDWRSFFFSFEFSLLESTRDTSSGRDSGGVVTSCRTNLLLAALSLCRMVLRGLELLAAPPHWIGHKLAG
jgi:hypothetical protein